MTDNHSNIYFSNLEDIETIFFKEPHSICNDHVSVTCSCHSCIKNNNSLFIEKIQLKQ